MFTLRPLPYEFGALEPYISARIMELHHDKHQQAYVNNLNAALEKQPELFNQSLESLLMSLDSVPESIRMAVRNNAGGDFNHAFFWDLMKKNDGGVPNGLVGQEIAKGFASLDGFKEKFNTAAKTVFGSGWAWLCVHKNGQLVIMTTANQDCPISQGFKPVMGLDVWEHAYYLQYENRRPDYIQAWWNVVNWQRVEENYRAIIGR